MKYTWITRPYLQYMLIGLLLLAGGITSVYLYVRFYAVYGVIFPGLIYTSITMLIMTLLGVEASPRNSLRYYLLMNGLYLATWLATMCTFYFAFLGGLVTAGASAMYSFVLADRYMISLRYKKEQIFAMGTLSFFITDIIGWVFQVTPVQYLFPSAEIQAVVLTEVIIIWQIITGIALLYAIRKSKNEVAAANIQ